MRRRDREVTDLHEIKHILDTGKTLHLGLVDDGKPYVVPMNFGYAFENDRLVFYVHGALEGRKLDIIRKNSACCVQIECDVKPFEGSVACQYGVSYYSLDGFGTAKIVDDPQEKMKALSILMKTQTSKDFEFNEKLVSVVSVIRIECDYYTAKHRPLPGAIKAAPLNSKWNHSLESLNNFSEDFMQERPDQPRSEERNSL
ncbi:MAG: pyridoxamine 5'-phosphate oxidase family protein [Clostridia bacterium]|nr:pyridoxamine 5'-phosphate oxidase family protein [Clostridia bacterium]